MDDNSCYFVLFTGSLAAIGLAIAFFQSKLSLARRDTEKENS